MSNKSLTTDERRRILRRAYQLIREPASWTTGHWRCRLYKQANGELVAVPDGEHANERYLEPVTSENGLPQYQYCIEGAVNQAAYDVLGEERATNLGAVLRSDEGDLLFGNDDENFGGNVAQILGLNDIARELYELEDGRAALRYNDGGNDHAGVLRILETALDRAKRALRRAA